MKQLSSILASLLLCSSVFGVQPLSAESSNPKGINPHLTKTERAPNPPRTQSPNQVAAQLQTARNTHNIYSTSDNSHRPKVQSEKSSLTRATQVTDGCTQASELRDLVGAELVTAVRSANLTSCLYGLYNSDYVANGYFTDAKLLTIVEAINLHLVDYKGTTETGATEIEKLVTYLRAGHWAESATGADRVFSNSYKAALQQAFESYFAGEHFITFNGEVSRDFMLRYEMLILVNSANTDRLQFLSRFSQAISGYATSVNRSDDWGVSYEENGMTQLLTHYFNGVNSDLPEVQQLLIERPEIIGNLLNFVMTDGDWLIGHTREYQWSDAISELGRLLKYQGVIADRVRPAIKNILATYSFTGNGSKGWVNAQNMVLNYDSENCSVYGNACDFNLESAVLSGSHICSDSLKIRFQQPLNTQNLQQICLSLTAEEQYFHQIFSNPAPVKNDNNTDLEIVIFNSSTEYQNYAGNFFSINTDNGGMYLEGTPSATDNQARFIAYQATWLPEFTVWNLEHEYVHYLDARFNQWGSFSDQPVNSVWWGEGLAEYLSKQDTNESALTVAPEKTYTVTDLLQTTYENGDTARVYYWGYLAVRFMFERHRDVVDSQLLPTLRAAKYPISTEKCSFDWSWRNKQEAIDNGWSWLYDDSENASGNWVWTCGQALTNIEPVPDFVPYVDIISTMTGQFDGEFNEWLDCIIAGGDCASNSEIVLQNGQAINVSGLKSSEQHFSLDLPENAYDLRIETQGTGDLDLYVKENALASLTEWDFRPYWIGSKEHVEILQPANQIDVMLYGYQKFANASLMATWKEGFLSQLKQWSALTSQQKIYRWVYVPKNAKLLYLTLSGGTGDAQLYVKQQGWPANNNYDAASSITRGTNQKIKLENIKPGNYYHILVDTLEGFNDVSLNVLMVE
jgi:microbial collagenase